MIGDCENNCGKKALFVTLSKETNGLISVCPECYWKHRELFGATVFIHATGEIKIAENPHE